MTTPKKPFAYTETQCVLEYLDPNFRYLLASRCPDLRTAHHNTPQRIKRLVLHDRLPQVTVNKAEHHVEYRVSGRQEAVQTARFLDIADGNVGIEPEVEIGWYRRLGELPNQRIHFSSPVRTVNEYNLFYRSLILEPREIGFKFTQIVVRGNIIEMLRELLREFNPPENRFFNENACITFQLDNQKELNIYCNGDSPYSEELTLTMEVMKAGSTSEGSI
uniref:FTH domain-containing protein n=1 Tax=Caenorhabditis tropicalis TaxID=1561998 RepID=A0A1I7UGM2_9PELO